MIANRRI